MAAHLSKRPEAVAALAAIARRDLTPENVVAEATDPASPLHPFFDWDDSSAGPKYRIIQARQLIVAVRVMIEETSVVVPIYIKDPERPKEQGYTALAGLNGNATSADKAVYTELVQAKARLVRCDNISKALAIDLRLGSVLKHVERALNMVRGDDAGAAAK